MSTKVGGVPEILPPDMISFANPDEDDVVRAVSEAIELVRDGKHDPKAAHERVRGFYDWKDVGERVEAVYESVMKSEPLDFWTRVQRLVAKLSSSKLHDTHQVDFVGPWTLADSLVQYSPSYSSSIVCSSCSSNGCYRRAILKRSRCTGSTNGSQRFVKCSLHEVA